MRPSGYQSTAESLIVKVSPGDRRQVQRRLRELSLNAWCSADGQLRVEINNDVEAAQVHSVLQQFVATRAELVEWLEQCWE
ncbi:Asr1405/Asl0597 family protein [Acaryochloris sp. IP29b_bin.148]|uniref:Asr1405/Asl0597 family protein n=1 Tax=Acaryochloris sp. IP29b_bin.148 TaxID=2969218 RepID=UPI00261FD2FA|nr:Asr1405/Asl0597 family protein [Acaryochloris sp. IP29b_bin.148]